MAGAWKTLETIPTTAKRHWEIEYSRFFEFPRTTWKSAGLRPLIKSTIRRFNGTWLSSSSPASLSLLLAYPLSDVALVVTLDGAVYEEHLIATLQFSWPQVPFLSERPTRGSRAVFATYRDRLGQVQKFALRFRTHNESQKFINSIKESLKNSGKNFDLEVACKSERLTSGRSVCRPEAMGSSNPLRSSGNLGLPLLNLCSSGMMAGHDVGDTLEVLPPCFTSFLAESFTEPRQGSKKTHDVINFESYSPMCFIK